MNDANAMVRAQTLIDRLLEAGKGRLSIMYAVTDKREAMSLWCLIKAAQDGTPHLNAQPHHHKVWGTWDDDNGPLMAGQPCEKCHAGAALADALRDMTGENVYE